MIKRIIALAALSVCVAIAPLSAATMEFEFAGGYIETPVLMENPALSAAAKEQTAVVAAPDLFAICQPSLDYGGAVSSGTHKITVTGASYAFANDVLDLPTYLPDITGS